MLSFQCFLSVTSVYIFQCSLIKKKAKNEVGVKKSRIKCFCHLEKCEEKYMKTESIYWINVFGIVEMPSFLYNVFVIKLWSSFVFKKLMCLFDTCFIKNVQY